VLPSPAAPTESPIVAGMGIYQDKVLPRIQDKVMNSKGNAAVRERVCAGLSGDVVEVGFGTGLNAPHYPSEVRKILAVEPSDLCMRIAGRRIASTEVAVERAGLTGESLDLPTGQFDGVLSTWTLCTIPDIDAALQELLRVLKPGGDFHFVEHGRSPDDAVRRWQHRIEPIQKRVGGGCHLTRRISERFEVAGFRMEKLDTYYFEGEPRPFGYTFEGRATKS
jgi:ubiquinone/menaquinone biosynthesis C-methylase UbiE